MIAVQILIGVVVLLVLGGLLAPLESLNWWTRLDLEATGRIAPPLLALAFALLAVPLARSSPRQARYGSVLLAFLAYLVGIFMMILGTQWLAEGNIPVAFGLWWLLLPMLGLGVWLYARDGRVAKAWWRR